MTTQQTPSSLHIELLSDSTFSRGEGTAGEVDTEIEHDEFGLPYIGGKTIRGLLRDSWLSMNTHFPELANAAVRVLGQSQSLDESCRLRIGDAVLPETIRRVIRTANTRQEKPIPSSSILESFTTIRYQTSENRLTGAPQETTLRSSRVMLREFTFQSRLGWLDGYSPNHEDIRILSLCALATRHGGLLRNRGRGHIRITLDGNIANTRLFAKQNIHTKTPQTAGERG